VYSCGDSNTKNSLNNPNNSYNGNYKNKLNSSNGGGGGGTVGLDNNISTTHGGNDDYLSSFSASNRGTYKVSSSLSKNTPTAGAHNSTFDQ
jgi:hypothetical protein